MVILIVHVGSGEVTHGAYVLRTYAFELVVVTNFIVHHPKLRAFTFTQPWQLVVVHGYGSGQVPPGRSNTQPYDLHRVETLRCDEHRTYTVFKHENYQFDPEILLGGLQGLGIQMDDLRVELSVCAQQQILPVH